MIVFLSLGSNLGDRLSNLEEAISLISKTKNIDMLVKSKIYETSPMENLDQDNFLNQVIQVNAAIKPLKLLKILKNIENTMGRIENKKKYMPRIIDIDILSYDSLLFNNQILSIPHPKIKFRKFILKPWTDIAPNYILPNSKSSIKELLGNISHLKDRVREYN